MFDRSLPALEPVETNEKSDETSVTPKKLKHYAGLANQGATCYMNSLLQTLFMTPEFRRVLYSWRYDATKDDEEAFCIPLQLQLLFGKMQLTDMRSTTTTVSMFREALKVRFSVAASLYCAGLNKVVWMDRTREFSATRRSRTRTSVI